MNWAAAGEVPKPKSKTAVHREEQKARAKTSAAQQFLAVHLSWASSQAERRRQRVARLRLEVEEVDVEDGDDVVDSDDVEHGDNEASYLQCCCSKRCSDDYEPYVVCAIRAAHSRLAPADQRRFYTARIRLEPERVRSRRRLRQRKYVLDDPVSVKASYLQWAEANVGDAVLQGDSLVPVCTRFFKWVLGVSSNKLYQPTMPKTSRQRVIVSPVKQLRRRSTVKREMAVETISYLGAYESIIMPTTGKRVLEHPTKKLAIQYARSIMIENCSDETKIPSFSYCHRVWKETEDLNENVLTRRTVPFATCDECFDLDEKIRDTGDSKKKVELFALERAHKDEINKARDAYYRRIVKATMNPEQYMSLIIDGADQKNNALPHHCKEGKATSALWKQPVHNMGVLSHGRQPFSFLCNDSMKQGTNVSVEALHRVLLHTKKQEGKLPPNLFLQLDNTCKQCKSQYMLGYLGSLLDSNVFARIIVSFLPVGHTHEDIDQMFSAFSKFLKFTNAFCREDLAEVVRKAFQSKAYKHPIHVELMDSIVNFSDFVADKLQVPEGISRWYQFRLFKDAGLVRVQCRESTLEGNWGGICATEVRDAVLTTIFKPGMHARIVPGIEIPPAQRRDPFALVNGEPGAKTKVEKYRKALIKFTEVDTPMMYAHGALYRIEYYREYDREYYSE